jgi:hypothetical protein
MTIGSNAGSDGVGRWSIDGLMVRVRLDMVRLKVGLVLAKEEHHCAESRER